MPLRTIDAPTENHVELISGAYIIKAIPTTTLKNPPLPSVTGIIFIVSTVVSEPSSSKPISILSKNIWKLCCFKYCLKPFKLIDKALIASDGVATAS